MIRVNKRIWYYATFAMLLLALLVRYSFQIDISRTLLTVIVVGLAMLGDRNQVVAVTMGCIPLHNSIDFFVAMVSCAVILVVRNPKKVRIGLPLILVILIVVWELLHCMAFEWTPLGLAVALGPLLVIAVYCSTDTKELDYALIVRTLAFVTFYMCILLILNLTVKANGNLIQAFTDLRRLGIVSSEDSLFGTAINPNSLGTICVLSMSSLLQLRAIGKNKNIDLIFGFGLLIAGVLTSSRTFLVCLLLMIILHFVAQKGNVIKKLRVLFILIAIGMSTFSLLNWLLPSVLENFIGRFQIDDITGGRIGLMSQYHEFIVSNLWVMMFGVGLTNLFDKAVITYAIANTSAHNSFQEIILAWGIPGLLMIILLIFIMFKESERYSKRKILLNFIPLIIILTKSMAGQLLTSGYTMLALAFTYLSLCQDFMSTDQIN